MTSPVLAVQGAITPVLSYQGDLSAFYGAILEVAM